MCIDLEHVHTLSPQQEEAVEPQEKVTPSDSDEVKGHVTATSQSSEVTSDAVSPEDS